MQKAIQNFKNVYGSNNAKKFIHYNAHDSTLITLYAALKLDQDYEDLKSKINTIIINGIQLNLVMVVCWLLNFIIKRNHHISLFD